MIMDMRHDVAEILYTESQLSEIVTRMGRQISEDYRDKNLFMISVLKGSLVFMADLMRAVTIPCSIDFLSVSSYGNGTTTTGAVRILKDLDDPLEGKDLLIVEDILDSGVTLSFLMKNLSARNPAASAYAPCWISRSAGRWTSMRIMWAPGCPINLSWAMVWIMRKSTGTFPISAC